MCAVELLLKRKRAGARWGARYLAVWGINIVSAALVLGGQALMTESPVQRFQIASIGGPILLFRIGLAFLFANALNLARPHLVFGNRRLGDAFEAVPPR